MNPLSAPISAPINRSIRRLYSASSAKLFMYTIVTQVNWVSYVGLIVKGERAWAALKCDQLPVASTKTSVFLLTSSTGVIQTSVLLE